jgi:hypothetical protein
MLCTLAREVDRHASIADALVGVRPALSTQLEAGSDDDLGQLLEPMIKLWSRDAHPACLPWLGDERVQRHCPFAGPGAAESLRNQIKSPLTIHENENAQIAIDSSQNSW